MNVCLYFQCPISVKFHVGDSLLHTHPHQLQHHPASCTMSMGVKWPGCGVDHPAPYSAATEHAQSYTCTPTLSLHCMSQKDLYLSPLGEPCHRYTNGYQVLGRHDLKQANRNSNAGNHQTTVHYKPDLVKHFRLTLVTFLAPVH